MDKITSAKSTLFIIIVWVILFLINQKINIIPILCGKGINIITGEYYRFITGAMLHNNFIHLLANCLALYWIGYYLEKSIGSGKFLAFGTIGCILSEVTFLLIYNKADNSKIYETYYFNKKIDLVKSISIAKQSPVWHS